MKNTTFTINPSLINPTATIKGGKALRARQVENLRCIRGIDGSAKLVPIGKTQKANEVSGMRVLCVVSDSLTGDQVLLMCSGKMLYEGSGRNFQTLNAIYELESEIDSCQLYHPCKCLVFTDGGPSLLERYDGKWTIGDMSSFFPSITLESQMASPVSTVVDQRELSRAYNGATNLRAADRKAVSDDYAEAYKQLCHQSNSQNLMLQPVLGRYKLYDNEGRLLFAGPPILIGPQGQFCDYHTIQSHDNQVISSYTLQADTWHILAKLQGCPDDSLCKLVARAEIYITPQFHPFSEKGSSHVVLSRTGSGDFLRLALPGRTGGIAPVLGNISGKNMAKIYAQIDDLEECICVIPNPFRSSRRNIEVLGNHSKDNGEGIVFMAKNTKPTTRHKAEALLRIPHRFSAHVACSGNGLALYGNLEIKRFSGYSASDFASSCNNGEWRAICQVKFADGHSVVRSSEYSYNSPQKLNPIISYPAPDATEICIVLYSGNQTRKVLLPLVPSADGLNSVYFSPDGQAIVPAISSAAQVIEDNPPRETFPDLVAVCEASNPLAVRFFADTGVGEIKALEALGHTEHSWEFGRSHFLAGGIAGISTLVLGSRLNTVSVKNIASDKIVRQDNFCRIDDKIYIGTGNGLRIADGNGKIKIIDRTAVDFVAHDSKHNEVYAFYGPVARVYSPDNDHLYYTRSDMTDTKEAYQSGGENFCRATKGIYLPGRETPVETTVKFLADFSPGTTAQSAWFAKIFARGSILNLVLRLTVGNSEVTVLRNKIDGHILEPLTYRLFCRKGTLFGFSLQGVVDKDFEFNLAEIGFREQ